jgi:hypothetical protein
VLRRCSPKRGQHIHRLCADRLERSSEKLQRFDDDVQDQGEKRGAQYCHQAVNGYVQHGPFDSNYPINHPTHRAPLDSDHGLTNPSLITILASGGDVPIGDCGASADDATKPALSFFPLQ